MENITSSQIRSLYTELTRDENVFELTDHPGIHIVRKYKNNSEYLADKRMFISFFLLSKDSLWNVAGGVDIVRGQRDNPNLGWTIQYPKGIIFQRPSNFIFGKSEDVYFDIKDNKVVFKNKLYRLNEFIDLLEKNHLKDMFLWSRLFNLVKIFFLHFLFFLSDSRYKKFDYIFTKEDSSSRIKEGAQKDSKEADPLFHFFNIYKNLLGLTILLSLPFLYILSFYSPNSSFSVSNPFLIFSALFLLYVLEKISQLLHYSLSKTNFVQNITRSALESRGKLKKL